MIPTFDGKSKTQLREFLSSCSYAVKNINPIDEQTLLEAILCTKLRGQALLDFETRDIHSFEQLKSEIEATYSAKRCTTELQIEFSSVKQRSEESALNFGQRVNQLAMELYESMIEGKERK